MDHNTKITSDKYKTIGQLLDAPIKSIILVSVKQKDNAVKSFLFEWLYLNHYSKFVMVGNLTTRLKNIANQPCYYYIVKHAFENNDILQHKTNTKQILNSDCLNFIRSLHTIQPSYAGTFMDYLMRRILCEINNKRFVGCIMSFDCGIGISTNVEFPVSMEESILKARDTTSFKSENILLEIFIASISQTLLFGTPNQEKVNAMINIIQNTDNIVNVLFDPLNAVCMELLDNKRFFLSNPALGYKIPRLNDKIIPSDCDFIIDDCLFDIKCTIGDKSIYEIMQLMGYASLYNCRYDDEKSHKIKNVSIVNLIQGYIVNYDISSFTIDQMVQYLEFLTKNDPNTFVDE